MYELGWSRLGEAFESEFAKPKGLSIKACHIGADAHEELAVFARRACGKNCLVISDTNTRRAGGDEVVQALSSAGKNVRESVFQSENLDATVELADEVKGLASSSDFLVAVGSGTLSDLAKYAGDALNRPVLLYATAASMNGYTSGVVALEVRGLKRTIPCAPATGVFANPEHAATAPQPMVAAGVGDFLSKCSSTTDWRASNILLDEPFEPKAREFTEGIQEQVIERASAIGRSEPEAVALVLEALLLSGFSMVIAGSSAPASGGEHLISHYIDMKSALYDLPHDLHGAQVGVATVYCLGLWESILALEPAEIDIDALVAQRPSEVQVKEWIDEDWGPVAAEVQAQWDKKKMDPKGLQAHLETFVSSLPRMRDELPEDLLPAPVVKKALQASGGPVTPEELNAPIAEYRNGQRRGRYIRSRFTVLDLAQDLGIS
ncbi:MAG: iron-containing alcohol dehydrogenase [Candidatus Hydrogenedentes bacterium]|nr:iron-containing alcohol dehydrogenase [Candidatus Hydrogenedentota bacterium]